MGGAVTCVTEEGNGGTGILFDNPTNTRVQAAFVAADFAAGGCTASCILSSISFRLDNFQASFGPANVGIVDIYLSEVASARSNANGLGLAAAYATNIDMATRVLVYSGSLTLSSANGSGSPNAFDVTIPFQTNYTYLANADLLFDITWTSGYSRIFRSLDATTLETGVNSTALGYLVGGPASGPNGSVSSNRLVAQFSASAVNIPEPGGILLSLAALGLLGWKWVRSRP